MIVILCASDKELKNTVQTECRLLGAKYPRNTEKQFGFLMFPASFEFS